MVYSKQRELVLNKLNECMSHPTADELYSMLNAENAGVSLATVYRNLNQLAENGMAIKLHMPEGADRFDGTLAEHFHLVCEACGAVVDVPAECVPDMKTAVAEKTGCGVERQSLVFYGTCTKCSQKN